MFLDEIELDLEGGKGGDGCVSFRREKYVPRGGPDGGDGGDGGSIILKADGSINSLIHLSQRKTWKADKGRPGMGSQRIGAAAEDCVLFVPPGTIVYDTAYDFVLKDLACEGDTIIAAQGGKGGKGNMRFKTSTNRAPRTATPGEPGEVRRVRLELKMIADVGLIGKPNAGKSTLLSCVTKARPEIASYPFTTKFPNLGLVLGYGDRTFIMADIPGLIEGAHRGVGLGHDFLRHIQRAGILVHLVEPLPDDSTNPWENYLAIRQELELFDELLGQRPELVVVTKADIPEALEVQAEFEQKLGKKPFLVCSLSGEGLTVLLQAIQTELAPPSAW